MAETPTDVLVAGYPDIDGTAKDFGSLGALVRDTQVSIDGVILVTHAPDGGAAVRQTGGNLCREGAGGGAGLAVGLFAPPLLASAAVGAVAGGVIVEFAGHRAGQGIHDHSDS
jgi:arylsulfatase